MNIVKAAQKVGKVLALTTGLGLAGITAAQADCFVTDYDKKGLFGLGNAHYSRTFEGTSAKTIWEDYCQPFIQRTIDQKNILNGKFGMVCTGRIQCRVEAELQNGQISVRHMDLGR